MLAKLKVILLTSLFSTVSLSASAEVVVADEGVEITRSEFEAVLAATQDRIRSAGANDLGDRFELINSMLRVRKLAEQAEKADPGTPGYWEMQFKILLAKQQFAFDQELAKVEEPDAEELAREYYKTQKDKYALRPETRASSHILLASPPGRPRGPVREKAEELLAELRAGADFEAMVEEYSDDKGSKRRKGSLNRWIRFGERDITPPYTEALFEIEAVGQYSEVTDSQFGVHIIRLDGIRESGYYDFETVKPLIIKDIRNEYRTLATKEINSRYDITDDAFIDGDAMEELFEPYKVSAEQAP